MLANNAFESRLNATFENFNSVPTGYFTCYQLFLKIFLSVSKNYGLDQARCHGCKLFDLIWMQAVYKGYRQMTLVGKDLSLFISILFFMSKGISMII